MVQIVNTRAGDARSPTRIEPVITVQTVRRSPLETILQRVASSTRLSLAEKRSFAESIKAAFEAQDFKQVVRIMLMIARIEAEREGEVHAAHSVEEIMPKKPEEFKADADSDGSDTESAGDTAQVVSGAERLQQLLTV